MSAREWPSGRGANWSWRWRFGDSNDNWPKTFSRKGVRSMGASKSKRTSTVGSGIALARLLWRPQNRAFVVTVVVALAAIGGSIYGWGRGGGRCNKFRRKP